MAKATPANLPSSLWAHTHASEVHLSTATSKSERCLYKLVLPCKTCKCFRVLEGLENMPYKRTAALKAVSPILVVATLFCNIKMTCEVSDSMFSSMSLELLLNCMKGLLS